MSQSLWHAPFRVDQLVELVGRIDGCQMRPNGLQHQFYVESSLFEPGFELRICAAKDDGVQRVPVDNDIRDLPVINGGNAGNERWGKVVFNGAEYAQWNAIDSMLVGDKRERSLSCSDGYRPRFAGSRFEPEKCPFYVHTASHRHALGYVRGHPHSDSLVTSDSRSPPGIDPRDQRTVAAASHAFGRERLHCSRAPSKTHALVVRVRYCLGCMRSQESLNCLLACESPPPAQLRFKSPTANAGQCPTPDRR